jgi:hypothetical protein
VRLFGFLILLCGAPLALAQNAAHAQTGTTTAARQKQPQNKQTATTEEKSAHSVQDTAAKPTTGVSPEKESAIRKLFEASGIRESMQQMLGGSIETVRPTMKRMLPPGEYQEKLINLFVERFSQKMKVDDIVELIIPIYDKYFSIEDIEGLTKFYETPAGKKALSKLTQVMMECQAVGAKFGEQAGRQAMAEVLAEHQDLQKALEDAGARKN